MAAGGRARNRELDPINLTPLLDCILNLIFFFLLATTIKENPRVMEVQLPPAGAAVTTAPQPKKEIVVTISKDGGIFYDNDAVTSGQLKTRLAQAAKEPGEPVPIRIRGDEDSRLKIFYQVVAIFRESGYPNFQLEAKPETRAPK
jgi:biopolymer transport protein ExbD